MHIMNNIENSKLPELAIDVMKYSIFGNIDYHPTKHTFSVLMYVLLGEFYVKHGFLLELDKIESRTAIFTGIIIDSKIKLSLTLFGQEIFQDITIPINPICTDRTSIGHLLKKSILICEKA